MKHDRPAVAGAGPEEAAGPGAGDPEEARGGRGAADAGLAARLLRRLAVREEPDPAHSPSTTSAACRRSGSTSSRGPAAGDEDSRREDATSRQRLGIALLTLLGMSIVIFVLLRLAPGDIVDILFSAAGYVNPGEKQAILKELGMDRPYWVQYLEWIRQIVTGDLGKSYRYDLPAWEIIRPLLPVTARAGGAVASWSRSLLGRADRRDQRGPPGHPARLRAARVQPGRALDAVVLAGHGDHPGAGGVARLDPADDLRVARARTSGCTPCSSCCPRWRSAIARRP